MQDLIKPPAKVIPFPVSTLAINAEIQQLLPKLAHQLTESMGHDELINQSNHVLTKAEVLQLNRSLNHYMLRLKCNVQKSKINARVC